MKTKRSGFTLIEILIDAFIITAIFGSLIAAFLLTLQTVNSGKVRSAASTLVNEQMERLRNLSYDSLSTQNGTILPQGSIPDSQIVTRSGVDFVVDITIITVDDPFDGCIIPTGSVFVCTDGATSPTQDLVPVDYKRISIKVKRANSELILAELSSNTAAKAAETPSNTGMLLIVIQDAQGLPIDGATVRITNTTLGVDITAVTNLQGYIFVANVPPDQQNGYHITATKAGFSSDSTTSRTSQNPNQVQPDVDIYPQQITTQTLAIDLLSNLVLVVKDPAGAVLPNVELTVVGSKLVYNNPDTPKNSFIGTTDSNGVLTLSSIEWDSYLISIEPGFSIVSVSPYQPFALNPNQTKNVAITAANGNSWPQIFTANPAAGLVGQSVEVVIEGDNLSAISLAELRLNGLPSIPATSIDAAPNGKTLTLIFSLSGATPGSWDIVISDGAKTTVQSEGFIVT